VTATTYTVYSSKTLLGHATFDSTGTVQLLPHKLNSNQASELLATLNNETLPANLQLVENTTGSANQQTTRSKAEWREFWLAQSLKRNEWAKRKGKPVAERPAPVSNRCWDW
jgi:hypothetical protein